MSAPVATPVVIVGTGLAGYNLAKEWRKLDTETPLLLITADDGRSYSKPMLSTGFGKFWPPAHRLVNRSDQFPPAGMSQAREGGTYELFLVGGE